MRKFRHVYIDIYMENIWLIVCSRDYFNRKIQTEFECDARTISKEAAGSFGVYALNGKEVGVIWLEDWGSFVHEVFHATCWVLWGKGIPLVEESEEAYAYLINYLCKEFAK